MDRKKMVIIGIITVLALGAGAAAALWSASGTGSGTARSVTAQTVTVTAATGGADLYPGFTGGDVSFTLTNPNPYPVTFTSMTPGAITSNSGSCAPSNISVAGATGLTLSVGAGATSTQSIADVVTMNSGALDPCQGVTFTIALTLTGLSS